MLLDDCVEGIANRKYFTLIDQFLDRCLVNNANRRLATNWA